MYVFWVEQQEVAMYFGRAKFQGVKVPLNSLLLFGTFATMSEKSC